MEGPDTDRGNPLVDALADWVVAQALKDTPLDVLFEGACKRFYAAGIPLARSHVAFKVLHPLFDAQALRWHRDGGVETLSFLHGENPEEWQASPLYHMIEHDVPYLRRRLTGESAMLDFPMLEEFKDQGYTDYLAFLVRFNETRDVQQANGLIGSWCTDRAGGFSNADIRSLKRIEQRLAVAFKINIQQKITENILAAYLGPGAGAQVLDGQIKRGDGERIHAVIWYSDMRNSTPLAASMSGPDFLRALNAYFECTAGAVLRCGGEVLRFIGDAVLAIFPIRGGDTARACGAAVEAAALAQRDLVAANEARRARAEHPIDFGLGLHIGELLFGNIGTPERVEFTVIGPAANEVARLESLTKSVKRRVLVSETFAEHLKLEWVPMGQHELRGVERPVTVYAPPGDGR